MVPRPFLIRRLAWALAPLAAALVAIPGCQSDGTSLEGVTHPTMIEAAPAEFLGSLGCADQPGSVQRYVATLFDVTEQSAGGAGNVEEPEVDGDGIPKCGGFQLPSSEPTSCLTSVGFGYVVHGRRYCLEVDAYDTDQLVPRGTGTRQMVVGTPGDDGLAQAPLAERRWHTHCEGAMASAATIVRARGCLPLFPQFATTAPGGIRLDTEQLLGELECGDEAGQISSFNIRARYQVEQLNEDGESEVVELGPDAQPACGDELAFFDLPANVSVSIEVDAFAGQVTLAGATCHARTLPGTSVVASCTPLRQEGTLRVDLEAALEAMGGLRCDESSVSDVEVKVGETLQGSFPPPDCLEPFDYASPPGDANVTVSVQHMGEQVSAICQGEVPPGRLVVADCEKATNVVP
jgi:hypothetical protein